MISYHFEIMPVVISSVQEGLELWIRFSPEPHPHEVLVPFGLTSSLKLGLEILDDGGMWGTCKGNKVSGELLHPFLNVPDDNKGIHPGELFHYDKYYTLSN